MDAPKKEKIIRFQKNLLTLRTVANWKAEEFSKLIGVTRQYYSELENRNKVLTPSLYLACLYVFKAESETNEELRQVLNVCLDETAMSEKNCQELSNYISSERKKKTSEVDVKKKVTNIVGATLAVSIIGIIVKSIIKK